MIETIYSNPNELYHYGVKGMKWGVRRYQNEDGTRTARGKIHEKINSPEFKSKAKLGAKIATGVVLGVAIHKVINNPQAISAGSKFAKSALSKIGGMSVSVTNSTEYKLLVAAGKGAKSAFNVLKSDSFRNTIAGIGAMAVTATALRTQINDLKDIRSDSNSDIFDRGMRAVKTSSDIGTNVSNLARGPKNQPGSSVSSKNGNLLQQTRDLRKVVGDPKGMIGADDEIRYQHLFKKNPSDEQRSIIKAMRKNGYSVDQIESYVFHSGLIGSNELFHINDSIWNVSISAILTEIG